MVHEKKLDVTVLFPQLLLSKEIGYFRLNFVHECCHSNELCVTKTDIIRKMKHRNT